MLHVSVDQMPRGEGTAERQFARQHGAGDDASQAAGVVTRVGKVGAFDAQEVEHGALRFEDGAAADGADFYGRHADGYLEATVQAGGSLLAFSFLELQGSLLEGDITFS